MSEYQYYEFQAIDRPLTPQQMKELRALSSRADITPTSFKNTYNWGNFRGNPDELIERYFDAFLYMANWGTRDFVMRFPGEGFDAGAAAAYCNDYTGDRTAAVWTAEGFVLLAFCLEEEPSDWVGGEGWLQSLLPLRSELLLGDLRVLYLGWLHCLQSGNMNEEALEPPLPPGLDDLSAPLMSFVDFFEIDRDLIAAAAQGKVDANLEPLSRSEIAGGIHSLSESEKDRVLLDLLDGEGYARAELRRRLQSMRAIGATPGESGRERRTVAELLLAAQERAALRRRSEAKRRAEAQEREERERALARSRYLDGLAKREDKAWQEVAACIETHQPTKYDRAVELLKDLKDLAARAERTEEFKIQLATLRERHAKKAALLRRFGKAGL